MFLAAWPLPHFLLFALQAVEFLCGFTRCFVAADRLYTQRCADSICFQCLLSGLLTSLSGLSQGNRLALARALRGESRFRLPGCVGRSRRWVPKLIDD
jgi:hypothetical protein